MNEKTKIRDIAIWVGKSYYTKESFIQEALALGCMRRVPSVPDIKVGKSRCFLIYMEEEEPEVFAFFTIRSIGYVVKKGGEVPKELAKRGVKPIYVEGPKATPIRGCGMICYGATYVLSEEDFEKCKDLADKSDLQGDITLIIPPIPWEGNHFRGFKYVDGDRLLAQHKVKLVRPSRKVNKWKVRYKTLGEWFSYGKRLRRKRKRVRRKKTSQISRPRLEDVI